MCDASIVHLFGGAAITSTLGNRIEVFLDIAAVILALFDFSHFRGSWGKNLLQVCIGGLLGSRRYQHLLEK